MKSLGNECEGGGTCRREGGAFRGDAGLVGLCGWRVAGDAGRDATRAVGDRPAGGTPAGQPAREVVYAAESGVRQCSCSIDCVDP